jgi:hypothetical protein
MADATGEGGGRARRLRERAELMAWGWGPIGIVYFGTSSSQQAGAHFLPASAVDRWFAFNPGAIWLYLSFFALPPLAYGLAHLSRARRLKWAMQISALGAGAVFILWPTTMAFPEPSGETLSVALLRTLMRYDSMHNCLPSLHVTLTALSVWALWDGRASRSLAFWVRNLTLAAWGSSICVSILILHRHQFVDLLAGGALAAVAAWAAEPRSPPNANSHA